MAKVFGNISCMYCRIVSGKTISKRVFRIVDDNLSISATCRRSFVTCLQQWQRRKRNNSQSDASESVEADIKKYEMGKRWLAKMMGADAETFTDSDVEESLRYLLPTKLFAKDARPVMKHPSDLFPEKKSAFSSDGRPVHCAFYTGAAAFHDLLYDIFRYSEMDSPAEEEIDESDSQKSNETNEQGKLRWLHQYEMEAVLQEPLTPRNYEVIVHRLKKLSISKPDSTQVKQFLAKYQTPAKQEGPQFTIEKIDESGKAHAKGFRKRAMAEVWVEHGTGKIVVNDTPLVEYFSKQEDRNQVWYPLIHLDCMDKFDVECNVIGGGNTGQAGAMRLAISRALTSISSDYLEPLQKAGLLTHDSRFVERKKPGQKKARKKFAWVKR